MHTHSLNTFYMIQFGNVTLTGRKSYVKMERIWLYFGLDIIHTVIAMVSPDCMCKVKGKRPRRFGSTEPWHASQNQTHQTTELPTTGAKFSLLPALNFNYIKLLSLWSMSLRWEYKSFPSQLFNNLHMLLYTIYQISTLHLGHKFSLKTSAVPSSSVFCTDSMSLNGNTGCLKNSWPITNLYILNTNRWMIINYCLCWELCGF